MLRSPTEWFADSLSVGLGPDQITLAYRRHGWHHVDASRLSLDIALTESKRPQWQDTLTELDRWLSEMKFHRASTRLVLSNHWIRVALLPWSDNTMSEAEAVLVARACLDAHYDNNDAWTIRIDRPSYGGSCLVVAIETALIDAIRELFDHHHLHCQFVLPAFVAAWNQWGSSIKGSEAIFAMAESGSVFMATNKLGKWHSARMVGLGADAEGLVDRLHRESMLQGFAKAPPIWLVTDSDPQQFKEVTGLTVLASLGEKL